MTLCCGLSKRQQRQPATKVSHAERYVRRIRSSNVGLLPGSSGRGEQATLSIAAPLLGIILLTRLASWFGQQPRLFCSASIILCRLLPRCRDSAFVVFVGSPKETKNVSYSYAKMPIHCARWQYTKRPNANGCKEGVSETSG